MRLPTFNPRLGQPLEVYVSHILSPDQFYAQLKDDNTQLEQVTKELEQHGDSKVRDTKFQCIGSLSIPTPM